MEAAPEPIREVLDDLLTSLETGRNITCTRHLAARPAITAPFPSSLDPRLIEALRARGIEVAAVVLGGKDDFGNRDAIARFGKMDAVLPLPRIQRPGPAGLGRAARAFDTKGVLLQYLK